MQTQQAMITWLSFISAVLLTDRKQCLKAIIRPEGSQSRETDGSALSFDGFLKNLKKVTATAFTAQQNKWNCIRGQCLNHIQLFYCFSWNPTKIGGLGVACKYCSYLLALVEFLNCWSLKSTWNCSQNPILFRNVIYFCNNNHTKTENFRPIIEKLPLLITWQSFYTLRCS